MNDPGSAANGHDSDLFREMVERAPHGVFVTDGDGRYLFVNDAGCRITGYEREDLLGRSVPDLLPENTGAAESAAHFERLQRDGYAIGELPFTHASGEKRWWHVEAIQVGNDRFIGFATDVTERHELNAQLMRERSRLERAQELASVGWWEFDLAADRVTASDVVADIYSVEPGTTLDIPTAQSFVDPADRPLMDQAFRDLVAGRAEYDVTFTVNPADGGPPRRVRSRAEYDAERRVIFGMLADMTEHVVAVAALERSEAQLRAIFDSARDYIYLKDQDLKYTDVNPAALKFIGLDRDQVIGRDDFDLFDADHAREIQATDRLVLSGAQDHGRFVRNHGGTERILETVKVPVRNAAGEIVGMCGVTRDVTDVRQLEEQLRQSQKMEAIGRLAGGVAHDFNNLLTPILGYASMLAETFADDPDCARDLAAITRAGERARDLTSNLLAFSRKQMLDQRVLSFNRVVEEAQSMLHRLLRENVQIRLRLAEDLGMVQADVSQLHNVIINLAVNAADAMPDGGQLTIETQNVDLDASYVSRHAGASPGPHVMIAITDTGIGMDLRTQQRLFEPFFTTKPVDEGTGLGLSTVHGIVKQHGGAIEVYSEPRHGTTFKVYLPRVEAEPLPEPVVEPTGTLEGDECLLVVEDDEAVRQLTAAALRKFGYRVTAVDSPAEAIALANDSSPAFDLLLTDVVMPGMNGAQLHRTLGDIWPDMPALYMSGYTSNVIAHHGVLVEGVEFIQKPFLPEALVRRVREILDG
jgi:PAS domain S-box-containing protein